MMTCQPQNVKAASLSNASRGGREQCRTAEREDHCVRVQRAQTAVGQERQVEIELRPDKLRGNEYAGEHSDDAPDDRHDRELAYNRVVVLSFCVQRTTPVAIC
jgi:hypothetical protein